MESSENFVLSPATRWSREGRELRLYSDSILLVRNCPASVFRWIEAITDDSAGCPVPHDDDSVDIIQKLIHLRFVVPAFDLSWQDSAWANQVEYFAALGLAAGEVQQRLSTAHVTILGVGGIGSAVLSELVGAGVTSLTLIDEDRVAMRNLNRQYLYRRADIGRPKVEAAQDWVHDRLPAARVTISTTRVTSPVDLIPMLKQNGFLVVAADTPVDLPQICAQACRKVSATMILGGCGLRIGASGPLVAPNEVETFIAARRAAQAIAGTARAPMTASFGPANTLVGASMGRDVLMTIAGARPDVGERRIDLV